MNGMLKLLIGAMLGKAMEATGPNSEEEIDKIKEHMVTAQGIDPAKVRSLVILAIEDDGEGAKVTCIIDGPEVVTDILFKIAEIERRTADAEQNTPAAEECDCSNCQLRRALAGKGMGHDLGDGVMVIVADPGKSVEDTIKEATAKPN